MAKIVRFHELGGPEVLKIEDVPSKQPSKDEVTLSVRAIGLNRAESMFMHGYYVEPTQLPATLGYEASGIVTAVGAKCRPRLAEQERFDRAVVLHESVWSARRRGHRSGSFFG